MNLPKGINPLITEKIARMIKGTVIAQGDSWGL
jgi:hypothetical protein